MNTSLSWMKMYVPDLDVTAQEYTDAMTLSGTTGTLSPSFTFGAPVTIWITSDPIFTWQMISLSASGCS